MNLLFPASVPAAKRRRLLRTILVAFFIFFPPPVDAREPISFEILFDGVPDLEGGWVLTVTLFAENDLNLTHLTVVPSDGLKVTAGDLHWQGILRSGEEYVMELSLTLASPPPQTVTIRAQGTTKEGTTFEKKVVRSVAK